MKRTITRYASDSCEWRTIYDWMASAHDRRNEGHSVPAVSTEEVG